MKPSQYVEKHLRRAWREYDDPTADDIAELNSVVDGLARLLDTAFIVVTNERTGTATLVLIPEDE